MLPNVLDTEGMTQALVTLVRLAQAPSAHDPDARGFVVVVASPSGGGGKTSLALNVASALSRWRSGTETVCVVDADVTSCDVGKYLLRYSPNVVTLSQSPSSQTLESIEEFLQRVF
jgi:Mrp family chromosome partitioning ATPase